jgi:hypothetical protein
MNLALRLFSRLRQAPKRALVAVLERFFTWFNDPRTPLTPTEERISLVILAAVWLSVPILNQLP